MRAVVLSNDEIIEFLNANFINTWVGNAELGHKPKWRAIIAEGHKCRPKAFDTNSPLIQTIIRGCKTGLKRGSPGDCFVISPELELMGRQPVNEYLEKNRIQGILYAAGYLLFLKEALQERFPGLGNVVLTREEPSRKVLNIFRTPAVVRSVDYTIIVIDAKAFEGGGTLTIDITVGEADGAGWFNLFTYDGKLSTEERGPEDALDSVWFEPDDTKQIRYRFDQGEIFKLAATGYWYNEKGSVNAFHARIYVE